MDAPLSPLPPLLARTITQGGTFYRIVKGWINQGGANVESAFGGTFADDPGGLALKHDHKVQEGGAWHVKGRWGKLHGVHCAGACVW